MGRSRRKKPFFESIEITGIAAEGKAITRHDDKVIFVPYVVPGDVVDLQVIKKRKNYMEARAVKVHQYSDNRTPAFCSHFGVCGGCKWQILPYQEQIKYKQQQVSDALQRIGKIVLPEISPIIGSKKTRYYRNKLEYTFSRHRWLSKEEMDAENPDMNALGFHIPGLFDKIVDVTHCYLQDEPSNEIRLAIKNFALQNNLSFYSQRQNEGLLRNLVVRTTSTNQVMVIVVFGTPDNNNIDLLMNFIKTRFQDKISSLNYIVNQKLNDSYADLAVTHYYGQPFVYESMEDLKFKVGPQSFYQTNSDQAYELYKVARNLADLKGDEIVYDLYTGAGTIACFVAKSAKKVIGIEYVAAAIADAKENAQLNQLNNLEFFAGDMKDVLTPEFIKKHGNPEVIIVDPPRAGMHESVVQTIKISAPQKIVYISCNPATQARDLALFDDMYQVEAVQPVDMFPHTHHVENVVLLHLRNELR